MDSSEMLDIIDSTLDIVRLIHANDGSPAFFHINRSRTLLFTVETNAVCISIVFHIVVVDVEVVSFNPTRCTVGSE